MKAVRICCISSLYLILLISGCILTPKEKEDEPPDPAVELTTFFQPPEQPNLHVRLSHKSSRYEDILLRYDSLRTTYPRYVTKHTLGEVTDGKTLHVYYFEPSSYENTILVSAGLHGNERLSVWGLYLFLRHLTHKGGSDPSLKHLRSDTRLVVVPVANPAGFDNGTRQNGNGVDLNRNFDYHWSEYTPRADSVYGYDFKGNRPNSEPETRLLTDLYHEHASATSYLDLHNYGSRQRHWPWYMPKRGSNDDKIYRQVISRFKREDDSVFVRSSVMPAGVNYVANNLDVHASVPEFSLGLFGDKPYDSADVTAAVRWYGNLIMGHVKL